MNIRRTAFLVLLGAWLAVVTSCSGDDTSEPATGTGTGTATATGGGTDTGTTTGAGTASGSGGGAGATGGTGGSAAGGGGSGGAAASVDCNGTPCDPGTQECCWESNTASCVDTGTCQGAVIGCDDPADCAPDYCCHLFGPPRFECTATCGEGNGAIVCDDEQDCGGNEPNCCEVMQGLVSICRDDPCN